MAPFDIYEGYSTTGVRDVDTASRLVGRFHWIEAQLMRIAAGRLALFPTWEVKCLAGRHLWQDSLHADILLKRMVELRWPRTAPLHPGEPVQRLIDLLDEAPSEAAYLHAVYQVLKPGLVAAYREYLKPGTSIDDEPSHIAVDQLRTDESEQVTQGQALLGSLWGGYDLDEGLAFQQRMEAAWHEVGSLTDSLGEVERELPSQFADRMVSPAPPRAARDGRFRLAEQPTMPPQDDSPMLARLIAHRDADNEMHAAEILGRNIYENADLPWNFYVDMARQLYDEVRHAVLYQRYLEELGGRLGEHPVVPGNYAYRMTLDLPHRLYDLHLRGERFGIHDVMRYRNEARESGDRTYALLNDFVHADEVPHIKNGRWLRRLLHDDDEAFKQIERETLERWATHQEANADDPIVQRYTGLRRGRPAEKSGDVS